MTSLVYGLLKTKPKNTPFRRLQSNTTMNGTLRATLVPYEKEDASHDAVVSILDEHAGSYPIEGEVSVSFLTTDGFHQHAGWGVASLHLSLSSSVHCSM